MKVFRGLTIYVDYAWFKYVSHSLSLLCLRIDKIFKACKNVSSTFPKTLDTEEQKIRQFFGITFILQLKNQTG